METRGEQPATRLSIGAPPQNGDAVPPPPPTPPTPTRQAPAGAPARRRPPAAVPFWGAGVAGLVAFGLGLAVHPLADAISSGPATVTIHGALTLDPGAYAPTSNGFCAAGDGFSDISAGTAVTIGDQTGATIAIGQLQSGRIKGGDSASFAAACTFAFDVRAPTGRTEYTVTVSHRGTQVVSPDQAHDVELTLGG